MTAGRLGSGTTTDNTDTSNAINYAGEIIPYVYENRDGTKSTDDPIDVTGYVVKVSYHAMELTTPGDIGTAFKKTGGSFTTHTTEATIGSEGVNGDIPVTIPSTILKDVGFTLAPTVDTPLYVGYEVRVSKGTEIYDILESDILGFRFSLSFDITA